MKPKLRFVQIQTHSRCNADCLFCPYAESWHAKDPGVMDEPLWLKILDELVPFAETLNQGKILPYFMQEPLIDKTIFTKIEQIYERFPRGFIELSSNGAALTDKVADRLITTFSGRRHALWVSFHGVDKATLEHIMKIDYERAVANLINLLKKADGQLRVIVRGAGTPLGVGETYFDRQTYLVFWQKLFKQHEINTSKVHVDAFTYHDRAGTLKRRDRDAHLLNQGKVRDIGPGFEPFSCKRVTDWIHIDYQGNLRLCCMDYHHEVRLPNIRDIRLDDYFESEIYRKLLGKVTGRLESVDDFICKRCLSPGG